MQKHTASHTVHDWVHSFMDALEDPDPGGWQRTLTLNNERELELINAYHQAKHRLLLLDYDGTLSTYYNNPDHAEPTSEVLSLLKMLAYDKENEVVILSGRSRADLEKWFDDLPLTLVAEHGAMIRENGAQIWHKTGIPGTSWMKPVLSILNSYTKETPGAFVEQKEASLVWHFRKASPFYAQKNLVALKRELKPILKRHNLIVLSGNQIIEIKSPVTNKGVVLAHWLDQPHDFIMALGDDSTDEDAFAALPPNAYSVKIGRGRTHARFRVANVKRVLNLLQAFTQES
jgi:trehalose 6-phosphate synthase/phosphatase